MKIPKKFWAILITLLLVICSIDPGIAGNGRVIFSIPVGLLRSAEYSTLHLCDRTDCKRYKHLYSLIWHNRRSGNDHNTGWGYGYCLFWSSSFSQRFIQYYDEYNFRYPKYAIPCFYNHSSNFSRYFVREHR